MLPDTTCVSSKIRHFDGIISNRCAAIRKRSGAGLGLETSSIVIISSKRVSKPAVIKHVLTIKLASPDATAISRDLDFSVQSG